MKVDFTVSGLDGVLDTLKALPPEIVSKRGGPVKAALRKAALVILNQAKTNLQTSIQTDGDVSTGFLLKNVIASRGKAPKSGNGERYLVRVKSRKYEATGKDGKVQKTPVTTLKTAHLMEYGSQHQPARPWLRPAYEAKKGEAVDVFTKDLVSRIDKVVKKLAKQNAGKK